jgi:hypothetical protein
MTLFEILSSNAAVEATQAVPKQWKQAAELKNGDVIAALQKFYLFV